MEDTSDVVNSRELYEQQKRLWMASYGEKGFIELCGPHIPKQVNHKSRERVAWITGSTEGI